MAGGIPLGEWSGSAATRELHETVLRLTNELERFSEESGRARAQSTRQTEVMIRLTWAIAGLTAAMLIAAVAQVVVALLA